MSQDPILCVSYFDHPIGPLKLYCSEPLADVVGAPDLFKNRTLEFVKKGHDEGGTFSFVYRKYQTVNHIFYIASELARGGNELMMITFIMFKYLDSEEELIAEINSKTPILEEFAEELKRLNGLTSFLHLRHGNISLADEELKTSFLEIFNRYLKKLSEKVLITEILRSEQELHPLIDFQDPILCVSYFDQIIGPSTLYSSESLSGSIDTPDINRILEFKYEEGTFMLAYRKFQTVNHIFYIDSDLARGGKDLLMITFMIKLAFFKFYKDEIVEEFKPILEEFAEDLKRLNGLTSFLHLRHSNFSFADEELKASFLEIFNRYLKKLNEKVLPLIKFENPLVLVIAKSDILNQLKRDYEVKGYKVITSKDTMEALKIIEERYNEISMVFIDTMMPHRGAYTILDEIKGNEKYKDIRIRTFSRIRQKSHDWSIPPSFFLK